MNWSDHTLAICLDCFLWPLLITKESMVSNASVISHKSKHYVTRSHANKILDYHMVLLTVFTG